MKAIEILFMAEDRHNPNCPYQNSQCTKTLDVVVACRNEWPWSVKERTDPAWRIVRVLGFDMEDYRKMQESTPLSGKENRSRRLFWRMEASAFDPDWLSDFTRTEPIAEIQYSGSLFTLRQPIVGHPPSSGIKAEVKAALGGRE